MLISPLEGEMPGRAEGVSHTHRHPLCRTQTPPVTGSFTPVVPG